MGFTIELVVLRLDFFDRSLDTLVRADVEFQHVNCRLDTEFAKLRDGFDAIGLGAGSQEIVIGWRPFS